MTLNLAEAPLGNASLRKFMFATLWLESCAFRNALPAKVAIWHFKIWKVEPDLGVQKHEVPWGSLEGTAVDAGHIHLVLLASF